MTVGELLDRMDSRELTEWMAYSTIEPFGEARQDFRHAMLCTVLANIWRGKNVPPYKIKDFLLDFQPPKQQTIEEMKSALQRANLGG